MGFYTWAAPNAIQTPGGFMQSAGYQALPGVQVVSVGIQTNNDQDAFVPTQFFVFDDGASASWQVYNSGFGQVGWWPWVVLWSADEKSANADAGKLVVKDAVAIAKPA